jgi:hypothetical protein
MTLDQRDDCVRDRDGKCSVAVANEASHGRISKRIGQSSGGEKRLDEIARKMVDPTSAFAATSSALQVGKP